MKYARERVLNEEEVDEENYVLLNFIYSMRIIIIDVRCTYFAYSGPGLVLVHMWKVLSLSLFLGVCTYTQCDTAHASKTLKNSGIYVRIMPRLFDYMHIYCKQLQFSSQPYQDQMAISI